MATLANENVIRFPDGGRGLVRPGALSGARDLMARRLREALRGLIAGAKRELTRLAEDAEERERRKFLFDTHDALMERGARLEALLAVHWQREFDAAASGSVGGDDGAAGAGGLQLVEQAELEEDILLRSLVARLGEACEEDVYAIGCRLGALAGRAATTADFNPAAPEVVCRALRGALREAGFATAERIALLRSVERLLPKDLGPVFGDLNSYLLRQGLLPNLKRSYGALKSRPTAEKGAEKASKATAMPSGDVFALLRQLVATAPGSGGGVGGGSGGGAPGLAPERMWDSLDAMQKVGPSADAGGAFMPAINAVHEFRASPVGRSLSEFDAVTVDIVAMLFDLIFNDKDIPDPIKSLVGRMQIPMLKVALLDKSFFASSEHPARRLLDGISRAAVGWGRVVDHADPLYRHVAHLVERVRSEFRRDTALFDTLCAELETFLQSQDQAAETQAARVAPLMAQREREEISAQVAHRVVAAWMAEPLPPVLADLFDHEWRALLVHHHLEGNDAGWGAAVRVAGDLIWSVQPKSDAAARKALVAKLPALVRELQQGLDVVGADPGRRLALTDALFGLHAAVLRGGEIPEPSVQAPATDRLVSCQILAGDVVVESISGLPGGDVDSEAALAVDDLQRGDWVEFSHAGQEGRRYRLSWVSPQRGVLLFTSPHSPRAVAVSPAALAAQIERGDATIVRVEPVFERAVSRALESLKAA